METLGDCKSLLLLTSTGSDVPARARSAGFSHRWVTDTEHRAVGEPPLQLLCRQTEVQWRSSVQSLAEGSAMALQIPNEEREQKGSVH